MEVHNKNNETLQQNTFAVLVKLSAIVSRYIGTLFYGSAIITLLTEVTKSSTGRLRPNFLSVCNLDYSKVNCSLGYVMISDSDCSIVDERTLADIR